MHFIKEPGDSIILERFDGFDNYFRDIQSANIDDYWNFPGSLTSPPCTEPIDWTIMRHHIEISIEQYLKLKSAIQRLSTLVGDLHGTNDRPLQRILENVSYFSASSNTSFSFNFRESFEELKKFLFLSSAFKNYCISLWYWWSCFYYLLFLSSLPW